MRDLEMLPCHLRFLQEGRGIEEDIAPTSKLAYFLERLPNLSVNPDWLFLIGLGL